MENRRFEFLIFSTLVAFQLSSDPLTKLAELIMSAGSRGEAGQIYVGNLARAATEADVRKLLEEVGTVSRVWVARNPAGYAFATFSSQEEADRAVAELNGRKILDREIRIESVH